jgi:hypothetical protein
MKKEPQGSFFFVCLLPARALVATLVLLQAIVLADRAFILFGLLADFVCFLLGLQVFLLLLFARRVVGLAHGALLEE